MTGATWNCCRLGASSVYIIQPYTSLQCNFIQSHVGRVYMCLAVTCHLHFWQNDRDRLRATALTRGWNGYRNKSQHRKFTLEKVESCTYPRSAMYPTTCTRRDIRTGNRFQWEHRSPHRTHTKWEGTWFLPKEDTYITLLTNTHSTRCFWLAVIVKWMLCSIRDVYRVQKNRQIFRSDSQFGGAVITGIWFPSKTIYLMLLV